MKTDFKEVSCKKERNKINTNFEKKNISANMLLLT